MRRRILTAAWKRRCLAMATLREEIRAEELRELGWPIVEERHVGRGELEGVAMEDQRVTELGLRLTDARNNLEMLLSLLVVRGCDLAQIRVRAQTAKGQVGDCLRLLRQEGFSIDIPDVGG